MSPKHRMSLELLARARLGRILLAASLLAFPALAGAAPQDEDEEGEMDEDDEDDEDDEEPIEFGSSQPTGPAPTGATESPGSPTAAVGMQPPKVEKPVAEQPTRPAGYPMEVALRPITLHAGMFEIGVAAPLHPSPAAITTALRGRYGITEQIEVGLRYGLVGADENGGVLGKAVSVDGVYAITDWAAAQLSLPVNVDPFAMGVTLGAPLKFRFGERFALLFGSDLITVRIVDFPPHVLDPRIDDARADAVAVGTIVSRGTLRFVGGAIYQLEPHMAISADGGVVAEDFGRENTSVPLGATFTYGAARSLDFSVRLGFDDIGLGESFSLAAGLAARM
jgi:hypothetical protein